MLAQPDLFFFGTAEAIGLQSSLLLAAVAFTVTVVPMSRTLFLLGAGAAFGLAAAPVVLLASIVGFVSAFLFARYFARDRVRRLLNGHRILSALAAAIDSEGWRIVVLVRLGPPIPNALQNYFFGLTQISIVTFTVASFFGTIPYTFLYIYLGSAGVSLLQGEVDAVKRILLVVAIAATGTVAWLTSKKAKAALDQIGRNTSPSPESTLPIE